MYDLTTLHFEVSDEDRLRKVGMSKEHRVDPQLTVGLLVTSTGLPLEVALFEGNKAETKTLVPVTEQFKTRQGITDLVEVADASMGSAANLNALEDVGCTFIVGSNPPTPPGRDHHHRRPPSHRQAPSHTSRHRHPREHPRPDRTPNPVPVVELGPD